VSAAQGVATTALVHAMYRSVELGQWVSIADQPVSSRLGKKQG
jgi:hypothetical protein